MKLCSENLLSFLDGYGEKHNEASAKVPKCQSAKEIYSFCSWSIKIRIIRVSESIKVLCKKLLNENSPDFDSFGSDSAAVESK